MKTIAITDKNEIDQIINSCDICTLSVIDTEGNPYAVPMNFGYHNDYIYLHGADFGKLMDCLQKNPQVCITFCTPCELVYQNKEVACSYRMKGSSVVARGTVEFITDFDAKIEALNILMGNYTTDTFKYNAPAVKNVAVYRIKPATLTGKAFGQSHGNDFPWQIERDKKRKAEN